MQLYDLDISGNCYKVRLFLSLLECEAELVPVDIPGGAHKAPEFLDLNPFGQIPVLVDGDLVLRDSQAIMVYLVRRYGDERWLPTGSRSVGRVMQWLSVAANELEHGPYAARLGHQLGLPVDLVGARAKANIILPLIEGHLAGREWLELDRPTIADIACYPAVALAPLGAIDMAPYPNLAAWQARVRDLPNYIPMPGID